MAFAPIFTRIEQGGTNNITSLTNGRVMVSASDQIVETTTTTAQVNLLDTINTIETGTTNNDKLVTQGYGDDNWKGGSGHLNQDQIYYVADAGNDSNGGRSVEDPFLTLTAAVAAVNAQTPSSSNQFEIRGIGAILRTEDITVPVYTHINAPTMEYSGSAIMSDNSGFTCKKVFPGSPRNSFVKSAGTGKAEVNILESAYIVSSTNLIVCTSGTLSVTAKRIDLLDGNLIYNSSGKVYLNVLGEITRNGNGNVVSSTTGGEHHVTYKSLYSTGVAGWIFNYPSGGGKLFLNCGYTVIANTATVFIYTFAVDVRVRMDSLILAGANSRFYDINNASVLMVSGNSYKETLASVNNSSTVFLDILDETNTGASIRYNDTSDQIIQIGSTANQIQLVASTSTIFETVGSLFKWGTAPLFFVQNDTPRADVTGDNTNYLIPYNNETIDRTGQYDNTTGVFTANQTGYYLFTATCILEDLTSSHTQYILTLDTTPHTIELARGNAASLRDNGDIMSISGSMLVRLAASQTAEVRIRVANGTKVVDVASGCYFAGWFLTRE